MNEIVRKLVPLVKAFGILIIICFSVFFIVGNDTQDQKFLGAAGRGDLKVVKKYLSSGLDVNKEESSSGWTALSAAAHRGQKEMVEYLILKGANPNKPNGQSSPLMLAIRRNHEEIVGILIKNGADINDNANPLAAAAANGNYRIVKMLIEHGALLKDHGVTALLGAKQGGFTNIIDLLKQAGAE